MTTFAEKGNLWVPPAYMSDGKKKKLRRNNMIFGVVALTLLSTIVYIIVHGLNQYLSRSPYLTVNHELIKRFDSGPLGNPLLLIALAVALAVFIGLSLGERSNILIPIAMTGFIIIGAVIFIVTGFAVKNLDSRHDLNNWFKQETGYSKNIEDAFIHSKKTPDNLVVISKDGKTFIVDRKQDDHKITYSLKEMETKAS